MEKCRVYYDKQYDRLMIAGKKDSDIISGSVRILNTILDFNQENNVVNAELLNVSEYLELLNLDNSLLNNIIGGSLSFRQLRDGYELVFILKTNKETVAIPYNIQLPTKKQITVTSA